MRMAHSWVSRVNNLLLLGLAGFSDYLVQYLKHTRWVLYVLVLLHAITKSAFWMSIWIFDERRVGDENCDSCYNFEYLKAEILNISKPYLVSLSHKWDGAGGKLWLPHPSHGSINYTDSQSTSWPLRHWPCRDTSESLTGSYVSEWPCWRSLLESLREKRMWAACLRKSCGLRWIPTSSPAFLTISLAAA